MEQEVPDEDDETPSDATSTSSADSEKSTADDDDDSDGDDDDDDEVVVEDVPEEDKKKEEKEVKMKKVMVDEWMHLNPLPPIWMRYVFAFLVLLNSQHLLFKGIRRMSAMKITLFFTRRLSVTSPLRLLGTTSLEIPAPGYRSRLSSSFRPGCKLKITKL